VLFSVSKNLISYDKKIAIINLKDIAVMFSIIKI